MLMENIDKVVSSFRNNSYIPNYRGTKDQIKIANNKIMKKFRISTSL